MKATRRTALAMLGSLPATVADARTRKQRGPRHPQKGPTPKLGILYPFRLTADMESAIADGWSNNNYLIRDARDGVNAEPASLRAGVDYLLAPNNPQSDPCTVIVALGGIHVDKAIYKYRSNEIKFFSLTGRQPIEWDVKENRRGGVTLHTPPSHKKRIKFLLGKLQPNEIALYRYKGYSANAEGADVRDLEESHWKDPSNWPDGSTPTIIDASEPPNFDKDFNMGGIPTGVKGLVISACPLFLGSLTQTDGMPNTTNTNIVISANAWVQSGSGRHIVWPLQEYLSAVPSTERKFHKAIGPKLTTKKGALYKLGQLAWDFTQQTQFDYQDDDEDGE
jgi:hypothetical protein